MTVLSDVNHANRCSNTLQLEALSYGLNYKTMPSRFNRITVEARFENYFDQLSNLVPTSTDNLNWFRNKLVDIANDVILTCNLNI